MRGRNFSARRLLLLVAVYVFSGQVEAHAKTIGIIMTGDIPYYHEIHQKLLDEMSAAFAEQNIEVVLQKPLPNPMSWTNAARKLKALGAAVIVTYGLPATLTAMKEAGQIPIIFAGVYSPETMNIGGKNTTGISSTLSLRTVINKLREISKLAEIGIIFNKAEKDSIIQAREIKKFEKTVGYKTTLLNISAKLEADKMTGLDALIMTSCSAGMCKPHLPEIVALARKHKVPTVALISGAEDLVVLTFSAAAAEQGEQAAGILRKVLAGEYPGNIPVRQPEQIEVIVNLKEALKMGIEIPAAVLDAATRVIEQ
ncbi:MAG: ABC transporter substrate binding protein [Desulfobulbales bacterium]|nr:ABC transporter substrate binding protein [Desulfobulbales bacterium]